MPASTATRSTWQTRDATPRLLPLTDPKSVTAGMGPVCAKRMGVAR